MDLYIAIKLKIALQHNRISKSPVQKKNTFSSFYVLYFFSQANNVSAVAIVTLLMTFVCLFSIVRASLQYVTHSDDFSSLSIWKFANRLQHLLPLMRRRCGTMMQMWRDGQKMWLCEGERKGVMEKITKISLIVKFTPFLHRDGSHAH